MKQNLQKLFEYIVGRLAQQKEQSGFKPYKDSPTHCQYRTKTRDGRTLKCAVGHLIPDCEYDKRIEATCASEIFSYYKWFVDNNFGQIERGILINFLCDMQSAHDNAKNAGHLRDKLWDVANLFGLNAKCIEQITEWREAATIA